MIFKETRAGFSFNFQDETISAYHPAWSCVRVGWAFQVCFTFLGLNYFFSFWLQCCVTLRWLTKRTGMAAVDELTNGGALS